MAKGKPSKKTTPDCLQCAVCCTYLNIGIDRPANAEDARTMLTYIYHKNVELCLDADGGWSVVFYKRCRPLGPDNKCAVYERRPYICRSFSEKGCHGDNFSEAVKIRFKSEKQFMNYLKEKRPALYRKVREEDRTSR